MIDITATDLTKLTAVELRKLGGQCEIKGASKGKKDELISQLVKIQQDQIAAAKPVDKPAKPAKHGGCEDCGRKVTKSVHPTLCPVCFDYAGWENTHSDNAHEGNGAASEQAEIAECPVCHPELDPRKVKAVATGRSRAGMVIVAKGSEIHKSQTFRVAAEAAGWSVEMQTADDSGAEGWHYATATKDGESISLAWSGRAYHYPTSSAVINGKDRKVRNLKEALRLL